MRDDGEWLNSQNWYDLVDEIVQLEELIREAGDPEGHEQAWTLHLLKSKLKSKRQSLRAIDIGLMPVPPRRSLPPSSGQAGQGTMLSREVDFA